jgi:ABC-2 type transport system permease protein
MSRFSSYVQLTFLQMWMGLKSAWRYRTSFYIETLTMVINDVLLFCVWILFFHKFSSLNGWTIRETQILFAMHATAFAFVILPFGGILDVARNINEGSLDQFLTQPRSSLWRILTSHFRLNVLGDLIFGIGMMIFVAFHYQWQLIFFVPLGAICEAWGILMVATFVQLLALFISRFEQASVHYFWALEAPALYPQNAFVGGVRVFLFTVVPALWIVKMPFRFVTEHGVNYFFIAIAFDIFITICVVLLLKTGLRRYESGNLIHVNRF